MFNRSKINLLALTLQILHLAQSTVGNPQWVRIIPPDLQKQIDDFINEVALPQGEVQGMGLGILQNNGELLYTTAYGFADISNKIPNTNDTQFGLGSVSKGFTALVTVKTLHEHFPELGEAVLDTPIFNLVPELNLTFQDRHRTEHVTMRDLLSHRVCLVGDYFSMGAEAIPTTQEILYRARYMWQECDLRTKTVYNNHMVTIAGQIAAFLANSTLEELVQILFNDLGMQYTSYLSKTASASRSLPYFRYDWDKETRPYNEEMLTKIIPHNAAGGIFSTPNDMLKYLSLIQNKGSFEGRQIIPPEVINWLLKPSSIWGTPGFKSNDDDKLFHEYGYGLGWGIATYDGYQYLEHVGGYLTYNSQVSVFPSEEIIIYSGTHEAPDNFSKIALHIFIFEVLKGNPNAKEIALKINKLRTSGVNLVNDGPFTKEIKNTGLSTELGLSCDFDKIAEPIPGIYGSGFNGEVHIQKGFDPVLNTSRYYFQWGKWYKGWLKEDSRSPGELYIVEMETDALDDFYAYGFPVEVFTFVKFKVLDKETPSLSVIVSNQALTWIASQADFIYGATLDSLPDIPWEPGTC